MGLFCVNRFLQECGLSAVSIPVLMGLFCVAKVEKRSAQIERLNPRVDGAFLCHKDHKHKVWEVESQSPC